MDDFSDLRDNDDELDDLFADEDGGTSFEDPATDATGDSLFGDDALNFDDIDDFDDTGDDFDGFSSEAGEPSARPARRTRPQRAANMPTLGMTAQQRFIISFLLLLMTCMFSMLFLLVFEKVLI